MLKSQSESATLVLWGIFCLLCLVLTTQNSLSMATAVLPSLSSQDDQSSPNPCQQCLAQGMLMIPVCRIAATAPAFPDTETNPVEIQVFKSLYPTAVECLCIANATAIMTPTSTQVMAGAGNGTFTFTGWMNLCDDQCSVSMVKAQISTLAVLSSLMGCNGTAPGLGPGSPVATTVKATESAMSTTVATKTSKATKTTTTTITVPKASFRSSKSVGSKKVPKRSDTATL